VGFASVAPEAPVEAESVGAVGLCAHPAAITVASSNPGKQHF